MATTATQWNLVVDAETDRDVKEFLEEEGDGLELSRFVEEAVKMRLFQLSLAKARQASVHLSEEEVETLVDEALSWARGH
jgi:hypothetical protein